jgi:glyoxylase-like metal-dependent hydrolase (beta-lactamase superfamily II)
VAALLEYPVARPPGLGEVIALTGGVHWARLPVPGALKHINVWLIEDGAGWTLVDCGMDVPAAREAWDGAFARYLGARPLTRIICTHHHPDHAGLAAWLAARYGAPVFMSPREYELVAGVGVDGADEARIAAFARDGLTAGAGDRAILSGEGYRRIMSGTPAGVQFLRHRDTVTIGGGQWTAHLVRGHTDAQLVLHSPALGLLIAGDQVLPRITSNIGIYPERQDTDPVRSFIHSFACLRALEPEPLVLPSHGEVFRGLRARLDELEAHHLTTLEKVLGIVTGPMSAFELSERLFRGPLEGIHRVLAHGEALANLEHLARLGRLAVEQPEGGIRRYRPAGEQGVRQAP